MIHLDTHVVLWLYLGASERLPAAVRRVIEAERLVISPIVELELQYLHEIGRAARPGRAMVEDLAGRIGLSTSGVSFAEVVDRAASLHWTRDPFDRLIAATALAENARLLTKDEHLLRHLPLAFWDGQDVAPI